MRRGSRIYRRAATVFVDWIAHQLTPELAARYGYRAGNPRLPPAPPIDRAHLIDPTQPRVVLGLPEPQVLAKIKQAWRADRKPANVAIVVDVSGLGIAETMHLSAVPPPDGVTFLDDPEETIIATIVVPTEEPEEPEVEEEAEVVGEEAAAEAGAEGATGDEAEQAGEAAAEAESSDES